ncbi:MAG TPA: thiamine-phosphate kinase [Marinobacter sp.]|uniref:thiamine-phosphate kinase n=1 Tax=Marinobacter sp. TaxID=50741 RepID=UPI00260B5ACA|nr:thiamine-phosphate kinase [Marinobacter sp.]HET8801838.1 thiamine-phosphate kinase [Marinobacter sp.]
MGEFDLIRQYFLPLARPHRCLPLGLGDDCAIQSLPPDHDLVFSVDTLVEGVHFPRRYSPENLGWRALAVAASDLAAMGAQPQCFTLALTLPAADSAWLGAFSRGLGTASEAFGLVLAGGDTTRGPLTLSLQVHGVVPRGRALTRVGARPGDLVAVSGTLGDAGAALDYLDEPSPTADMRAVLARYHHPYPRLELGQSLRDLASAAIDISDGTVADLGHILAASGVGANIESGRLPVSAALERLKGSASRHYALCSGDDYELCLTLSEASWQALPESVKRQLTVVGRIERNAGLRVDGQPFDAGANPAGFDHFGGAV